MDFEFNIMTYIVPIEMSTTLGLKCLGATRAVASHTIFQGFERSFLLEIAAVQHLQGSRKRDHWLMMRSILASDRSDFRLHFMKVLEVLASPELLAEITEREG